jgi:excisionase family DNA binding protein
MRVKEELMLATLAVQSLLLLGSVMSLEDAFRFMVREVVREVVREELADLKSAKPATDEYMTIQHAAGLTKVNEETVRRWVAHGELRAVKAGRHLRVKRSELERFLAPDDVLSDDDVDAKVGEILRSRKT